MKTTIAALVFVFVTSTLHAQIGIGTTSPNSTLDVRGSLSTKYTAFSAATTAGSSDYNLVFTGTSAATLTLPDATACQGRAYWIKNTSSNSSVLTIATTSSQTVDGVASWSLTQTNKVVCVISNGANWLVASESLPGASAGTPWIYGGNNVVSQQNIGTISNYNLPFITNNTEKMRLTSAGNLGIGTSTFNGTYPERLIVDGGATGNTNYQNVIVGKGNTNSYAQLNIQNTNTGTGSSSDVVATASNGDETVNFIDMGINGGGNTSTGVTGGANTAYLYSTGNDFAIGNGTNSKNLNFFTTTGGTFTERMRIDASGNVGIGTSSPSYKLTVSGASPLYLAGVSTGASTDSVMTIINGVVKKIHPSALAASNNAWSITGNASTNPASNFIGTTDAEALVIKENNTQVGRFEANSIAFGNGATTNTATNSYALGSSAAVSFGKTNAFSIGNSASVSADNSLALGNSASATASNALSIGNSAIGNSANVVVVGPSSTTGFSAASSIAIGNTATANSPNAIAIGTSTTTGFSLTNPVTIGNGSSVNGNNAVALGNTASVGFVANATALGAASSVTGANSTAVGYNTSVTAANAVILGDRSNTSLSVGIGSESFSGTNREKLLVDIGASGGTAYQNVIVGKGNTNSYAQLNIQNFNTSTGASSDVVATSDNGNETVNYIDMGINGSGNTSTGVIGGANTAYLYSTGNDFAIGNGTNSKNLNFFTTTSGTYTERMRITSAGNVGIANTSPAEKLDVTGNLRFSGALMPGGSAGTAGEFLISTGSGSAPIWFNASGYAWLIDGNNVSTEQDFGTTSNYALPFITNGTERMRISNTGNVGIGTSTFNGTYPERLIVDAGSTGNTNYQNVIVGKGNTNSYAQLNIQNGSAGTGASSDVVATANNGNESINYIDMGVNGGGNTSTGILGGANTAYLLSTGNDFVIGNSTNAKDLLFYTTTSSTNTERMRILSTGNVGIATSSPASTLQVGGSFALPITTKTANYTATASDYTIVCNNSGGITITLPAASGAAGRMYVIKKISAASNNVTIDANASETIDGAATRVLTAQYESVTIQCDGTSWYILSKN